MKHIIKYFILSWFVPCLVVAQQRPHAPLYWSVYEYCYEASGNQMNGGAIPEEEWKRNIDWVAEHLKPYGYDIICIDGWGDDFAFNENGYRTKHASGQGESGSVDWTHDYAWWSQYIQSKGMTLGMYNNPLWINRKAAHCPIKGREDLTVGSLMDENEQATWFTWVQVDRPGAEEYVKNYVQYYADMGVKYLRVDFLSWFEDGRDKLPALTVPNRRPKEHYRTALRWIKEACDRNGMTLSLVMPHLYNDAESELIAAPGSLIRVNEDVCDGGWYRLNNIERGIAHDIWSKFHNMFDGLVYWSRVSDRMIPDGDFTRINTFANDDEKRTAVSIQLMAGGPIAVADRYNTIGNDLPFYTNEEMLLLNREGFIGKPMSNDPTDKRSQVWTGQLPCGDWVVGLFNREDVAEVRRVDFATELGFATGNVRDLWEHREAGTKSELSENIPPHGCKVFRISPTPATQTADGTSDEVQILPLPGRRLQIKGADKGVLTLFDLQGKIIARERIGHSSPIIKTGNAGQGVFIAGLTGGKQEIRKKIIIK